MKSAFHLSSLVSAALFGCAIAGQTAAQTTTSSSLTTSAPDPQQSQVAPPPQSKAEASQLYQDTSPQARARLAQREAHAAFQHAMRQCRGLKAADRTSCMNEARTNLRNDLAYARNLPNEDTQTASSSASDISLSLIHI